MKPQQLITPILAGLLLLPALAGADDYESIRKDVRVISKIVSTALEEEPDCKRCRASVSASYLARQGVILNLRLKRSSWFERETPFHLGHIGPADGQQIAIFTDEDGNAFSSEDWPQVIVDIRKHVDGIPEMVSEILEDVRVDGDWEAKRSSRVIRRIDSDDRDAMRELRRKRQSLEDRIRDVEIDIIHAKTDDAEKEQARLDGLSDELETVVHAESALRESREERNRKQRDARTQERERERASRLEQQDQALDVVFAALCDYGVALKNLPRDEHVSLVVSGYEDDRDKVFVMEKPDVTACGNEPGKLREKALSYVF